MHAGYKWGTWGFKEGSQVKQGDSRIQTQANPLPREGEFRIGQSFSHEVLRNIYLLLKSRPQMALKPRVQFTFHPAPQNAKWGRRKGYSRGKVCSEGASHVVTRTSWGTTRGLVACMYEGEGMEEGMPARRHSGPLGI